MAYTITFNDLIQERIRHIQQEAIGNLQGEAFLAALKHLMEQLQINPHKIGEINYHLSQGEPVCTAARAPLSMKYAIYEQPQVVWIIRVDRLAAPNE